MSSEANNQEYTSIFGDKYNIPSRAADPLRWDKSWEKALRTISPSEDVFPKLGCMWKRDLYEGTEDELKFMTDGMHYRACTTQAILLKMDDDLDNKLCHLLTAWILLGESEKRRHLFTGIKDACEKTPFGFDARPLSPEITTTAMLKQNGKAFVDFARNFAKGIRETDPDNRPYLLPSNWWKSGIQEPEPWSDDTKFVFTQLSVQRNEYIAVFVLKTLLSVLQDLGRGSPGMDNVTRMLEADAGMASAMADMLSSVKDKPLIRCQNCTKTPEEIGEHTKFMICSACKTELNFIVHYCSSECQKADWRNHKKHCGKKKIAKELPGTIHDRFWQFDVPNTLRHVPPSPDGMVAVSDIGFGVPHPSRTYSPALKRQISLLESDRSADYIVFDCFNRPSRFVIYNDDLTKICFRTLRAEAIYGATPKGLEMMAEYILKAMAHKTGFSREMILAQLEREFGGNVKDKMAAFEARRAREGAQSGTTFLDGVGGGVRGVVQSRFPEFARRN